MTREEAIEKLKYCKSVHNGSFGAALKIAIKELEQEPKIGHWSKVSKGTLCSICGCYAIEQEDGGMVILTDYCPWCGAKMVKSQESEAKE